METTKNALHKATMNTQENREYQYKQDEIIRNRRLQMLLRQIRSQEVEGHNLNRGKKPKIVRKQEQLANKWVIDGLKTQYRNETDALRFVRATREKERRAKPI